MKLRGPLLKTGAAEALLTVHRSRALEAGAGPCPAERGALLPRAGGSGAWGLSQDHPWKWQQECGTRGDLGEQVQFPPWRRGDGGGQRGLKLLQLCGAVTSCRRFLGGGGKSAWCNSRRSQVVFFCQSLGVQSPAPAWTRAGKKPARLVGPASKMRNR